MNDTHHTVTLITTLLLALRLPSLYAEPASIVNRVLLAADRDTDGRLSLAEFTIHAEVKLKALDDGTSR